MTIPCHDAAIIDGDLSTHAHIEQMLSEAIAVADADLGIYYLPQRVHSGQLVVTRAQAVMADKSVFDVAFLEGAPPSGSAFDDDQRVRAQRRGQWSGLAPSVQHTNAFSTWFEDYLLDDIAHLALRSPTLHERLYGPLDIGDQCRALMYQGRRSLGWFGVFRQGKRERFSAREAQALQDMQSTFRHQLAALVALDDRTNPDAVAHLIVEQSGQVSWCSRGVDSWLDTRRLGVLRAWIKRSRHAQAWLMCDGVLLLSTPLRSRGCAPQLLITLEPCSSIERAPLSGLPPCTVDVAWSLVKGMSCREIAGHLSLGQGELDHHLDLLSAHFRVRSLSALRSKLGVIL